MIQTEFKIYKEGSNLNDCISKTICSIEERMIENGSMFEKVIGVPVTEDNFEELYNQQETYNKNEKTYSILLERAKQRRLACFEIDW